MLRRFGLIVPALLAVSLTPAALSAGPPWISIELPANPLNQTTRGMFLLVRTYHHGNATAFPVNGTATGIVDGKRRTLELSFERTNIPGVMALRQSWPAGAWVLAINIGGKEGPTALVGVGRNGEVQSVKVPTRNENGYTWGREVTGKDIDEALRAVALDAGETGEPVRHAALLLVLPAAAGLLALRRR